MVRLGLGHGITPSPEAPPPEAAALRAALTFEFDLPYPDGDRMGLVDEAIAAFEKRLGVSL